MNALRVTTTLQERGPAAAIVLSDEQVAHLAAPTKAFAVVVQFPSGQERLRLVRMGGENLIGLRKEVRERTGCEAGDTVTVEISYDAAPREIDVPEALVTALAEADLQARFEALAPSRRKECARQVSEAKSVETQQRRIAKIVSALS